MSGHPAPWPRAVVFDLDGTLVDSAPDLATAVNHVLAARGLESFDVAEVRGFIGNGVARLVDRAFAGRGHPLRRDDLIKAVETFKATYRRGIADRTRPYPGALDLVLGLRRRGIATAICTNKAAELTAALLEGLGWVDHFDVVVGGTPEIAAKPAADMLLETLRRLDVAPADAVMIGDSETDVACARAAGIPVVGVTFGYTKIPMRELGADAVIDHLDAAPRAVAALAASR